jgi:hypothetical protein
MVQRYLLRPVSMDMKFAGFSVDDFKIGNIKRHQESKNHKKATLTFLKLEKEACGAPTLEQFQEVWKTLRSGDVGRKGATGIGKYRKLRQMFWCLAEGMKDIDREFLSNGKVVVILHRDERKSKLLVRYSAANAMLRVRQGSLGIRENVGGAININKGTEEIVKEFFTPRVHDAYVPAEKTSSCKHDSAMCQTFLESVEMVNVDSADDERLACLEGQKNFTPNAKLIARDKSHGARRPSRATPHEGHLVQPPYVCVFVCVCACVCVCVCGPKPVEPNLWLIDSHG